MLLVLYVTDFWHSLVCSNAVAIATDTLNDYSNHSYLIAFTTLYIPELLKALVNHFVNLQNNQYNVLHGVSVQTVLNE